MSVPLWAVELASAFWAAAGEREAFPRNLRRPIARALPLSVVLLPDLRVRSVTGWFDRYGIGYQLDVSDRPLRACLIARHGCGLAFIDGTDSEDEQRFSLAHELAHFLRDYWQPRCEVAQKIGRSALEVLDGQRPADPTERLSALLQRVPLGFHTHLMDRTAGAASGHVIEREAGADRLAFELVAPTDHVFQSWLRMDQLEGHLQVHYGLPRVAAATYASVLSPAEPLIDPLLYRLGVR